MSVSPQGNRVRPPSIARIADHWYIVCRSEELNAYAQRPMKRTLMGLPIVLFRDADGLPAALVDRCPHRNAPLSFGRIRPGERTLECGYHGWQFDAAGECRAVPGLCLAPDADAGTVGRRAAALPVAERQGYVWVMPTPDAVPSRPPFEFPRPGKPYTTVPDVQEAEAPLFATIENALDVPHTAFLHRGLFRKADAPRTEIEAVVTSDAMGCAAQYIGESRPKGLAARLLAPAGGEVVHFDRFFLPSIAQVEYALGSDSHFIVTTAMTPLDDWKTRLYAEVTFRLPIPAALVRLVITPVARRIFSQDAELLSLQSETIRHFGGETFVSTEIDVLGRHIWRLMRAAAAGAPPPADAEHRIRLAI